MTLRSDPYAVLGLPRDASADQIGQARRRLSRQYHPDVNPAPDAAARFDEIQQAFHLLSDPAARSRYDRSRDERFRDERSRDERSRDERDSSRVTRDPAGGYGPGGQAPPGILIQPATVDFGRLTPRRPSADARVTLAWTGPPPSRLECGTGGGWWASLGSEWPATSCVVFYLRAHAHAGTPNGRQQAEFAVIFDDATLTVQLTAEIQGEFPPGSPPDFTPRPRRGLQSRGPALPGDLLPWLTVIIALALLLVLFVTH